MALSFWQLPSKAGIIRQHADVVELADTHALGACAVRLGGSNPSIGTLIGFSKNTVYNKKKEDPMPAKINSYVNFNGNAREAIEFYKSVFGGEVYMDTFEKFNSPEMPVADTDKDKLMHAFLKGDNGIELMASDTPSTMQFEEGSRITLTLNGDDEALLRGYWDKLSQGGTVTMPLEKAPWGDIFGMLTDKFGVKWMVDIGPMQ